MNQFTMRQRQRQGSASGFLSMHDLELKKNDCEAGRVASLKLWKIYDTSKKVLNGIKDMLGNG